MSFQFEKLRIWQEAMDLSDEIDLMVMKFPLDEKFVLSIQMKRAALSVALNIAEGSTGQSKAEFRRFLSIAQRSCVEVLACLHKSARREFINLEECNEINLKCERLLKGIQALKNTLKPESSFLKGFKEMPDTKVSKV